MRRLTTLYRPDPTVATVQHMDNQAEHSPTPLDRVRQVVVLVGGLLALFGAFIGSGALGGTAVQDAAGGALAADATLLAPYGPAFSIWSVIYVGLLAYSVWQLFPGQAASARHRLLGWLILASQVLNAAWILSVQAGLLGISVFVITALLVVLIIVFVRMQQLPPRGWGDVLTTDAPMGLYLGWVTVATIANITAWLVAIEFTGFAWPAEAWAVIVILAGTLIACTTALWSRGRLAPALATAWGLAWIGAARVIDEPYSPLVGMIAFIAAALTLVTALAVRVTRGASRTS